MTDSTNISKQLMDGEKDLAASLSQEVDIHHKKLGRRALERLDLLLLVVESLDLNSSQALLWTSDQLGLNNVFPNRVELWKCRCHNPLRRVTRRGKLKNLCPTVFGVIFLHFPNYILPIHILPLL